MSRPLVLASIILTYSDVSRQRLVTYVGVMCCGAELWVVGDVF